MSFYLGCHPKTQPTFKVGLLTSDDLIKKMSPRVTIGLDFSWLQMHLGCQPTLATANTKYRPKKVCWKMQVRNTKSHKRQEYGNNSIFLNPKFASKEGLECFISRCEKKNKCQPRLIYLAKVFVINEVERKLYMTKNRPKEFIHLSQF